MSQRSGTGARWSPIIVASMAIAFLGLGRDALAEDQPVDAVPDEKTEDAPEKKLVFGLEKGVVVPIGDWGSFAGIGLGVLPRLEYRLSPRLAVTFNPGLVFRLSILPAFHGGGVQNSTTELLVTGGLKHLLTPRLGVHALAGLNIRTIWRDPSQTRARGMLIAGGGYRFARRWSAGANLLIPNLLLTGPGERVDKGLMITVGHGFR